MTFLPIFYARAGGSLVSFRFGPAFPVRHTTPDSTFSLTTVPSAPSRMSATSFRSPMAAHAPGFLEFWTKSMAAWIFGPMDPGNSLPAFVPNRYSGVTSDISRASGFPKFSQIPPPSVKMMYASASSSVASLAPHASLSITASTPCNVCGLDGIRETGTPPPPQAIGRTDGLCSNSVRIESICRISSGAGDGTTRRKYSPSGLMVHPNDCCNACASCTP
mmetsp:Transcript_182/g.379  ORF Transcript_182/g.379 Transcript_182/m.379 type:complete len:219 (-) Transcript_182:579-1235(-)